MTFNYNNNSLDECINALSAGAYGDGAHDDTIALNNLLKSCKNVYLPTGRYLISGTIEIPEGVYIHGDGFNSVIKLASTFNLSSYRWRTGNEDLLRPIVHALGKCILSDFLVCGDETQAHAERHVGVLITGSDTTCKNISTKNINYFPDSFVDSSGGYGNVNVSGIGVFVFQADRVSIIGGSFVGNGYEGIGLEHANYCVVDGCYVGDGNRTGIQIHRYSNYIKVNNCVVNNKNSLKHADLTIHGTSDAWLTDLIISNCSFIGKCENKGVIQTVWGYEHNIKINGCFIQALHKAISFNHNGNAGAPDYNIIINNIVKSLEDGIYFYSGDKNVIASNILECTGSPITISSSNNVIANNLELTS
jgi:parallel beta-helix repeat protein